jgi:serine/threonine-protein kinase
MPPTRLGPYVLHETIARGALWTSYRAEHREIGRSVIIKTLKPNVSVTSPFASKLAREAKILGKLQNESIVTLFDFVRSSDAVWLALEDTRGFSLRELLQQAGPLSPDVAAAIALGIARGLGHAHSCGVVRGALRPEHVTVSPGGRVYIHDWSSARELTEPEEAEPVGDDGIPWATDYLTPEHILGEKIGPCSDVFSLGVVTFEMIAGNRPFTSADAKEVMRRIRSAEPPSMSTGETVVPASIERLVRRCLAKHPGDRYEDGSRAVAALEKALAEQTDLPARTLVLHALGQANLAGGIRSDSPAVRPPAPRPWRQTLAPAIQPLLVVFALIVTGGAGIEMWRRGDDIGGSGETPGAAAGPGQLRVLARPWAEVFIDGEPIDSTPIGRPIPLPAGRHYVTFRHPNAPEEQRTIRISSGQTVLLDVTMRVERPAAVDAGSDAQSVETSP